MRSRRSDLRGRYHGRHGGHQRQGCPLFDRLLGQLDRAVGERGLRTVDVAEEETKDEQLPSARKEQHIVVGRPAVRDVGHADDHERAEHHDDGQDALDVELHEARFFSSAIAPSISWMISWSAKLTSDSSTSRKKFEPAAGVGGGGGGVCDGGGAVDAGGGGTTAGGVGAPLGGGGGVVTGDGFTGGVIDPLPAAGVGATNVTEAFAIALPVAWSTENCVT